MCLFVKIDAVGTPTINLDGSTTKVDRWQRNNYFRRQAKMIPLDASVLGGVYFYRTDCGSTEIGSPNKRSLVPGGWLC